MPKGIKMEWTGVFATTSQKTILETLSMRGGKEELARFKVMIDKAEYIPDDPDHFIHLCAIGHGLPGLPEDESLRRYELNESGEFILAAPVWRRRKEKAKKDEEKGKKKAEGKKLKVEGEKLKVESKRSKVADAPKARPATRGKYAVRSKQEDLLVELCNRTEEVNKIRSEMLTIRTELEGIEFDYNKRKKALDECVKKYAGTI